MYAIKGKLQDGTSFKFTTAAEQLGGAAQDLVAALAAQENTSPVEKVTFTLGNGSAIKMLKPTEKKEKGGKKKPAGAAK
jgi:hypothetical protein